MRKVITLRIGKLRLVGTAHYPASGPAPAPVGFLLLNAGPAPRAGNSDLSARLGDHLSTLGFPTFRVDLPGLGDSEGEIPVVEQDFWEQVQGGRNDQVTLDIVDALHREHGIGKVVLGGLCAGAITSLQAADRDRQSTRIAGLLMLEPNLRFDLEPLEKLDAAGVARPDRLAMARRKVQQALQLQSWLYLLTGEGKLARLLTPAQPLLRRWLTALVGHDLPRETNLPAVLSWQRAMSRSLPTLLVTASGHLEERDCQRILAGMSARARGSVSHVSLPNTNHILTAGEAIPQCLAHTGSWARSLFGSARA